MNTSRPPLFVIAGPTASGKSGAALMLAERTGATVVNMDALQVYRDLRVLTARPSAGDQARAPHRLFGHLGADVPYDAGRWLEEAREAVAAGPSVLVGGTGLYLRAALQGLAPVPPIDPAIREEVRSATREANWHALTRADPDAAARLRPSDTQRIARALEVIRSTGRSLFDWQARRAGAFADDRVPGVILDPPPADLARRIENRLAEMMEEGAVDEVRALVDRPDLLRSAPIWRALGALPIAEHLDGELSLAEALARTIAATRAYAKRQRTWFRHQAPAPWPRATSPDEAVDLLIRAHEGVAA